MSAAASRTDDQAAAGVSAHSEREHVPDRAQAAGCDYSPTVCGPDANSWYASTDADSSADPYWLTGQLQREAEVFWSGSPTGKDTASKWWTDASVPTTPVAARYPPARMLTW